MAAPFDLERLEVTGEPVAVVENVRQTLGAAVDFTLSETGTLVYVPDIGSNRTLVWLDPEGNEEPLPVELRNYENPRISPDGSRLAFTVDDSGNRDVWIYDLRRNTLARLTFDAAIDSSPLWTPDGMRVVFGSNRAGRLDLYWKAASGTGQVEPLTESPTDSRSPNAISADGKNLLFTTYRETWDIYLLSLEGDRSTKPILQTQFNERYPTLSSDGRWMAYVSDESGRFEIYVRPFPNVEDGKWLISRDGGIWPVWGPNDQKLFYRSRDTDDMMVVDIEAESTVTAGFPVLFARGYTNTGGQRQYDISPDGKRLLMMKEEGLNVGQLNVVLNWFEELKRLVPTN